MFKKSTMSSAFLLRIYAFCARSEYLILSV